MGGLARVERVHRAASSGRWSRVTSTPSPSRSSQFQTGAASQSTYAYTPLNQLCYAGSTSATACTSPPPNAQPFAYDAGGNLTALGSTAQTFNSANQATASGSTTYQYDSRGNRISASSG